MQNNDHLLTACNRSKRQLKKIALSSLLFLSHWAVGQKTVVSSVDDLFKLALDGNIKLKNAAFQRELADVSRKYAAINAHSPRIPLSYQLQDNLALQKAMVPGFIFGQPEGTYMELVMGQKYASTFSLSPQIDLLDFANLAQKKSAVLGQQQAILDEKQAQRELFLQINSAYHTVLSLNAQQNILKENLDLAQKIKTIIKNRVEEGVARVQELNEAEVNLISLENNLVQLGQNLELQQELLGLLTQRQGPFIIEEKWENKETAGSELGSLDVNLAEIRQKIAKQEWLAAQKSQWPVLSAFSSFSWQNLSNTFFYGRPGNRIHSAFIGLKLTWDLPTNVPKLAQIKTKEIQLKIADNTLLAIKEERNYQHSQQRIEYQKAVGQRKYNEKVSHLKKDTFEKDFAQFEENILALDKLLVAQNDWLLSRVNLASAQANEKFTLQVLKIYNSY